MPFKELLNSIHDSLRFLAHSALVPVIAVLKAVDAGVQHLVSELSKV